MIQCQQMGFNFIQNIQYCQEYVEELYGLLLYSHIPAVLAVLLIGYLVRSKNNSLLGKILFSISIVFSVWVISNLLIWIHYYNNSLVMSLWASIETFALLLYFLCLYFTYVFIKKKDLPFLWKIIFLVPLLVPIVLAPTDWSLTEYDVQECIAISHIKFEYYVFGIKIMYSIIIGAFAAMEFFRADKNFKKQILLMSVGIIIFLLSFMFAGYIAVLTENFIYEAMGLFGMVIFVGFLGYLIVTYKTFNVKVIATQALVFGLLFLISSQFFFIQNNTNRVLTGVTALITLGFGFVLIRSVKREIIQKESIQKLATNLERANEELKEMDRHKDELLSLVSHQLATPISSIKWYLEMMQDGDLGKLTKAQKEHVLVMYGISNNLSDLVSMILDVSRIQLGRIQIEKQELDLQELFNEILAVVDPRIKEKKLKFILRMPKKFPKAMLDRRYTRMTIENLLTNAIKYTPEGGIVEFTISFKDDVMCCIVNDTGCGIPKQDQGKIFGKMFRASNVVNFKEGNGFGLFVAKGAVEAQGGQIKFVSTEGKGTTFTVILPLKSV